MCKYKQLCLLEPSLPRNKEGREYKQESEEYIDSKGRKRTMYITRVYAKPKIKVKGYVGRWK